MSTFHYSCVKQSSNPATLRELCLFRLRWLRAMNDRNDRLIEEYEKTLAQCESVLDQSPTSPDVPNVLGVDCKPCDNTLHPVHESFVMDYFKHYFFGSSNSTQL